MPTVKFIIRSQKKEKLARVYIRLIAGRGIDVKAPSKFYLYPEYWNNRSQTFSKRIMYTDRFTPMDKDALERQFRDFKTYILNNLNQGAEISKSFLMQCIEDFHDPYGIKSNVDLNMFIEKYIKDITSGKRLTEKNRPFGESTIKPVRAFKRQFELYQEQMGTKISYKDIDLKFHTEFINFFYAKNYSANTIGKYIRILKMIMRHAREEGYHNNSQFERREFKSPRIEVDNIYLSETDLMKLQQLDLSRTPHLDIARDVFLVGCHTAQRYSDFSRIRKEHIRSITDDLKAIEIRQQKTGEKVMIPIKKDLWRILVKHDYNLPYITEQKLNKYIKEVGKLAELTESIIIQSHKGGIITEIVYPKYELIKTHTARRTGCTNMYLAGIPVIDIMKISGHKTEKEFMKYIKVSKLETAQNLSRHPYFTGN
jgi:hypothetical protein